MALLYIIVAIAYLAWRTLFTVNMEAPYVSLPFLAADYIGFGFFLLFVATLWSRRARTPTAPPLGRSVDVYITTYNEDLAVLQPTVLAAVSMDYPHVTYVLDDGRREEVRHMCEELGARYLTRGDNRGAKAGNINAALPRTSGEFIAFFDADHAPFRNFLTELLGYFEDPGVALVQSPQAYYNLDSFQHARPRMAKGAGPWHEQSVFYDAIMPGKDRWNAAFWCGSSAIVRRTALEAAGGVDTRTVTEDMHTAMNLHAAGWKSVYDRRELAIGIAPDDASAFLTQRSRWAKGALQILRNDNPLLKPGLTFRQRISYFTSVTYVFEYVPKLVYLLTPIIALLVGELPMRRLGWAFLLFFFAYWLLGVLASSLLTIGRNPYFAAERFHLLKLGIMLTATLTVLWPRGLKFKVTPKSGDGHDHRLSELRLLRWQLAIGLGSVAAVSWAAASYASGASWELRGEALIVTGAWATFNAGLVASLCATVLRRHHRRQVYRFQVDAPASVTAGGESAIARVRDVSAVGLGWESPLRLRQGQQATVRFRAGERTISADVEVQTCFSREGTYRYGARFASLDGTARHDLILWLYQQHAPGMFQQTPAPVPFVLEERARKLAS